MEACLGNFVHVFEKVEVPDEFQVRLLKSVLTGEYIELIHSVKLAEHTTYEEARILLQAILSLKDRLFMTRYK